MRTGVNIDLPGYMPGEILYLCGVTAPYRHALNFHLALRIGTRDLVTRSLVGGQEMYVQGATAIPFDDQAARRRFPERDASYLTCRNFQFGAQQFERAMA